MNKLVPVEPTEAMIEAAINLGYLPKATKDLYAAMLQASPPSGGEVTKYAKELLDACIAEFGDGTLEIDGDIGLYPDDEKVSYPEDKCNITFGHIRRLQAALGEGK